MKKVISILAITICSLQIAVAQSSGWFWQNPLPQGNYTTCLNFFDINTGICVTSDAILKTNNGGQNWSFVYPSSNGTNGNLFMVDRNIGYLVIDTIRFHKSTDGGSSWSYVTNLPSLKNPILYFKNQNTGFLFSSSYYLRGYGEIYRTGDSGLNWQLAFRDTNFTIASMYFADAQTGYAAGSYGNSVAHLKFLKTTNAGVAWDTVANTISNNPRHVFFLNSNTGFVGGSYISKTTNAGLNWINVLNASGTVINQIEFVDLANGYALGNNGDFFKTTNAGDNWQHIDLYNELGGNDISSVSFVNSGTGFGVGEGGQYAKTTNAGANWIKMNNNDKHVFWSIKFSDALTGFAGSDNGKLYRTTNGGSNWDTVLANSPNNGSFEAISNIGNSIWYVGEFVSGKVFKTTNTGLSWDTQYTNHYGIHELDFIDENTGYGICKYYYFLKTTNGGLNWQTQILFWWWSSNGLDFINANTGYTCGQSTIFKTTNGAQTWDSVVVYGLNYLNGIQFFDASTGYLSGDIQPINNSFCGVMKTIDGGLSWSRCIFTGDYEYTQGLSFVNVNTGFALTTTGLFKTTNGGANFDKQRTCNSNSLYAISFTDPLIGYCAGSHSTIIKTTTGGEPIGLQPISTEVPGGFALHQNYPNPFNPVTKIRFSVPSVGNAYMRSVRLVIYDITGREVAALVNEQLNAGVYEVDWDASAFASGVYFYQFIVNTPRPDKSGHPSQEGNLVLTKKMVLLK